MAISTIKQDHDPHILRILGDVTSFTIPTQRAWGTLIIQTAYSLYFVKYDEETNSFTKIAGGDSGGTISSMTGDRNLTVNFSAVQWGGIMVIRFLS